MSWQEIEREIKAIPGNGPTLEKLTDLLEGGEAIALVGAGASAELWPMWDKLLQGLIEYTQHLGEIKPAESRFFQKEVPQTPLETIQQLRNKIGDKFYYEYLEKNFGDKISPQTGKTFTSAHLALLQLPIQNYLTLNYDAGLTNARSYLYPETTVSYYFWDQEEAKNIQEPFGFARQILHAHGRYDRPDSIVITLDDYRKAYSHNPFVRLLNRLFDFNKLIMTGFDWKDPFVRQLFDNISGDYKNSLQRHIALVGLDDEEMKSTALYRERVQLLYGARIIFYPSRDNQKTLAVWLSALAEKYASSKGSKTAKETEPLRVSDQAKSLADKYIHEPTDDENFKGREQDFAVLNRLGRDPATRIIAVTGIGGQGKTSLVGRWLKRMRRFELTPMPVFYWSFYEDLDVGKFLEEMTRFLDPVVSVDADTGKKPISLIMDAVREIRLLLVLDGVEVLQAKADSPIHGQILDPLLEQLLRQWVHYKHQALMILTSRFAFPQLNRYSGAVFHHLKLPRLSSEEGISLLKKLGVLGNRELLGEYVEKLYGHPLALKILAATVKRYCRSKLAQFEGEHVLSVSAEDEVEQKLDHLLGFYEKQLKDGQKELLGIISLFKRPVDTKNLVTLLGKMKSLKNTPLAGASEAAIQEQIKALAADFLIEETKKGITCHPAIRDHSRRKFNMEGFRREVADFLQTWPGGKQPQNIEEVRDLVEAVQLLCEEEEFKAAADLRVSRLERGGYGFNVFRDLPAPVEGLECSLAFAGNETRREKVKAALGETTLAIYIAGVSHYNFNLGNLLQAREWRNKSLEIFRSLEDKRNEVIALYEISKIENALGNIKQAQKTASQALLILKNSGNFKDFRTGFAYDAYYHLLLGEISLAYFTFELALMCEQQKRAETNYLYADSGNLQAEFFLLNNLNTHFEKANARNIENCKKRNWNVYLAICYLLQGRYEIKMNRLSEAEKSLAKAERILRPVRLPRELSRLEWAWGLLAEAKGDYKKGLEQVDQSLLTSEDKGFSLWQADGLCLRGRLLLQQYEKERKKDGGLLDEAGDNGHKALKTAEECGYFWAKVEALELLYFYHKTKATLPASDQEANSELAQRYCREAKDERAEVAYTEKQLKDLSPDLREIFEFEIMEKKEFKDHKKGWNDFRDELEF